MTTGHVFAAVSLDGFIARPDGGLDWLAPYQDAEEDYGYDRFIGTVDGLAMGRATFETVRAFPDWPYALPVVVMSRSLTPADLPSELVRRVEISDQAPAEAMAAFAARGWRRVYVDGGRLIQSFLAAGLIEDLTLAFAPVLLGAGRPLFGPMTRDIELERMESAAFASGLTSTRYRVRDVRPA